MLAIFFLFACQSAEKKDNKSGATSLPHVKETMANFSDSLSKDHFKLELIGKKPAETKLLFTIKNAAGKEIYRTQIAAKALFDNYDTELDLSKEKNQVTFLHEEAENFFAEENFLEPAVAESEQPDANVPDKAFYNELKKTGLNGFKYRLGKESNLYIAWSEQLQKVQVYYKCC